MKKLIKNKFFVLAICVALVSCAYLGVEKLIDEYAFNSNSDFASNEWIEGELNEEEEVEVENSDASGSEEVLREDLLEEVDVVVEEESVDESSGEMEANEGDADGDEGSKIYIYITGEVNVPGVVILNEGSRIVDAIDAAGGTTERADISKVNLVYVLEDGMKVNIPNSSELKDNPNFEYITMSSGDGASEELSSTLGGSGSTGASFSSGGYSVVNINTATQTELESLPGIGPSLALKIINYRKENGKFSSVEEIKNVSGIGESKFEELKNYIKI